MGLCESGCMVVLLLTVFFSFVEYDWWLNDLVVNTRCLLAQSIDGHTNTPTHTLSHTHRMAFKHQRWGATIKENKHAYILTAYCTRTACNWSNCPDDKTTGDAVRALMPGGITTLPTNMLLAAFAASCSTLQKQYINNIMKYKSDLHTPPPPTPGYQPDLLRTLSCCQSTRGRVKCGNGVGLCLQLWSGALSYTGEII